MKIVSPFEYAIMQAVHESNPEAVTSEDLKAIRPQTKGEVLQQRKENITRQLEKIRIKKECSFKKDCDGMSIAEKETFCGCYNSEAQHKS